ncbi:MAG TPA: hypothetical protein VM054_00635 [bacterium]|nr:hypothetical protein [bacterium]
MASGDFKDSGCLGGIVLGAVWFVLFFAAIFIGAEWLITAASLSIATIPLGYLVGNLLAGRR